MLPSCGAGAGRLALPHARQPGADLALLMWAAGTTDQKALQPLQTRPHARFGPTLGCQAGQQQQPATQEQRQRADRASVLLGIAVQAPLGSAPLVLAEPFGDDTDLPARALVGPPRAARADGRPVLPQPSDHI